VKHRLRLHFERRDEALVEVIPAIDCKRGWQIRTEAFMGKHGMAGKDRGRGAAPGGQECARTVGAGGGQATDPTRPCELCALLLRRLRKPSIIRQVPPGAGHGLRIALVADDDATRLAAQKMVEAQRDGWTLDIYDSCGHAPGASRLTQKSRRSGEETDHATGIPPDIVLIGLSGPDLSHCTCVRKLKALSPTVPLVIISGPCNGGSIMQGCQSGADGWLVNSIAPAKLARAISSVAQGAPVLCAETAKALVHFLRRRGTSLYAHDLTPREQEIVGCLAAMLSNKEICERLAMNKETLHVHLVKLYQKFRVHNRGQAVRKLLRAAR
jgi:DNA-binding NarL/FixJ family response regulator